MPRTRNYMMDLFRDIFERSRGGKTRLKIISLIRSKPLNANQLASELGIDYRATRHHVDLLERNNLIRREGGRFGAKIFVSNMAEAHMELIEEILRHLQKSKKYVESIPNRT